MTEEDSKQKSKNDALTAVLEKAAAPLKDKVGTNEKEMSQLRETLMNAGEVHFGTATEIFKPKRKRAPAS